MVGVQEQKKMNRKHLSVVSSVHSTFITRMNLVWCQRRGSVSLHSLQVKTELTEPENSDMEKYIHIFKKCMWTESLSIEEEYYSDATISCVIDCWISFLTLSEHTILAITIIVIRLVAAHISNTKSQCWIFQVNYVN